MNKLMDQYAASARFMCVYIMEAHAADEWPIGTTKVCVKQHCTQEDRIKAAKDFIENYNYRVPVLLDVMTNEFNSKFAAWPERWWIVHHGKMVHIGVPSTEFGYDRSLISQKLDELLEPATDRLAERV